jgi:hypothetical protein
MSREEREDSRKKLEKINEMDDKEHSPLILVLSEFQAEKSPSKPGE